MKIPREGAAKTRQGILEAAADIFSEKGFRETTIAEICERAGTNIASVNYHFRSKQTLYIEAWRHAFSGSIKAHPPSGDVGDDAPLEDRFRGYVTATLRRMADENNREFWFMQRELANPTGLLAEVFREEIQPLHQRTAALVRGLLGPQASEQEARFCEIGLISQCVNPMVAGKRRRANSEQAGPPGIDDIEAYADHVVKFSLAGFRALREAGEEKRRMAADRGPAVCPGEGGKGS